MNNLKSQAIKMRQDGYSYSLISQKLGVSKSSMSYWFRDMAFTPNQQVLERIKRNSAQLGIINHERRVKEITQSRIMSAKELGVMTNRDLWMFGLGIYLGEGAKTIETIRVSNADPLVIKTTVRWLREICNVPIENITLRLHIYPDNDINKAIKFWSMNTGVLETNFTKPSIDLRTGKSAKSAKKLPYGTAHLSVKTLGNPIYGAKLYRRIEGWMRAILNQV